MGNVNCKTPITYYGGKQQMASIIIGMIPAMINKPRRKQEVLVYNYDIYPNLFNNQ